MSRAPGYLGNYEHRSFAGLGSYGGMGQLNELRPPGPGAGPTVAPLEMPKTKTGAALAFPTQQQTVLRVPPTPARLAMPTTATATVTAPTAAMNRAHVEQAKALYCSLIAAGKTGLDEAAYIVRKEALEKWGWTPDYARRVIVTVSSEVGKAAKSDFEPWTGCPPPRTELKPRELPGAPTAPGVRVPAPDQPPPPAPRPVPQGPVPETYDAYGPSPAPPTDILPDGPPTPGVRFDLPWYGAPRPRWGIWLGVGLAALVVGYLVTRRPRRNPRRRRRARGRRRRR